jgi:hypothetical protein
MVVEIDGTMRPDCYATIGNDIVRLWIPPITDRNEAMKLPLVH